MLCGRGNPQRPALMWRLGGTRIWSGSLRMSARAQTTLSTVYAAVRLWRRWPSQRWPSPSIDGGHLGVPLTPPEDGYQTPAPRVQARRHQHRAKATTARRRLGTPQSIRSLSQTLAPSLERASAEWTSILQRRTSNQWRRQSSHIEPRQRRTDLLRGPFHAHALARIVHGPSLKTHSWP